MKTKVKKYKIGSLAGTFREIKIYHATDDTGKTGYRITSVISKRLFASIAAAKKAIMSHDVKMGYGKVKR